MVRYQAGDLAAFDLLYQHLAPGLRRYLRSLSSESSRADDLLQETFLQIHKARRTFDPMLPVAPWAYAIARHVHLMDLRARSRRPRLEVLEPGRAEAILSGPEAPAVASGDLDHALAQLTPGRRSAVLLHHLWGWSFQEIGEMLRIPAGAAKLRASRGVRSLRQMLTRKGDL
jgi:RNA polymerase sigma-70 factor (ECF subfamily)